MAVVISIRSVWDDKGAKAARRDMSGLEKKVIASGGVWDANAQKVANNAVKLEQWGKKAQNIGGSMSKVGNSLTLGVTLPIAMAGTAAFKMAGDFETSMNQVRAASGASESELRTLGEAAKTMGVNYGVGASEAAAGILELAKSGMSAAEIQAGGLQVALDLAAAGGLDMATAATVASNAMNTFGIEAKDAALVADALAGGANASSASVDSLQQALAQAGTVANAAGLSLNETVGTLAMFADRGIQGSDAGTSLKTMLSRLIPQTDEATDAMEKYGLSFVDAKGNYKSMADISQILQAQLGGLSAAERDAAIQTIFGSDAKRAALLVMESGAEGLEEYIAATEDLEAAEKMALAATEGSAGSIEKMKASLESASIEATAAFAPSIMSLADSVKGLAEDFRSMNPATQDFIIKAVLAAAALGPLLSIMGSMTKVVGSAVSAYGALSAAALSAGVSIGALVAPYLLFAGAVAAVGLAAYGIYRVVEANRSVSDSYLMVETYAKRVQKAENDLEQSRRDRENARIAAADAEIAKKDADLSVVEAQKNLKKAIKESGAESNEAARAQVSLDFAQSRAAKSAKEATDAQWLARAVTRKSATDLKALDEETRKLAQSELDRYNRVKETTGSIGALEREYYDKAIAAGRTYDAKFVERNRKLLAEMVKAGDVPKELADRISGGLDDMYDLGAQLVQGLLNGMNSKGVAVRNTTRELIEVGVKGTAVKYAQVRSPSRMMRDEVGVHLSTGVAEGIKLKASAVSDATRSMLAGASDMGRSLIPQVSTTALAPAGAGGVTMGDLHVHVSNSNASPNDIAQAVTRALNTVVASARRN